MFFQINSGNPTIQTGTTYDSGFKYDDGTDVRIVKTSFVAFGALPNATTKNLAHSLSIDPDFAVAQIIAQNGTNSQLFNATVDGTNVSLTTTTDLSAYTGIAVIQYVETTA